MDLDPFVHRLKVVVRAASRTTTLVPMVNGACDAAEPTVDAYLDEWVALQRTRIRPTSWTSYVDILDAYVRPRLGPVPLAELTVRLLDRHYVHLLCSGNRRGGPLSRRTVQYTHAVLRKALNDAVEVGLLPENVATRAHVPRVDPTRDGLVPRPDLWDAEETRRFLAVTTEHRLHDLWRVALGTGMRRGELVGLRWEDVDLSVPQLRVTTSLAYVEGKPRLQAPKTGRARTLHLDVATAEALARQPERDVSGHRLVFTRDDGTPWPPASITDRWRCQWPRLAELGVPRIRFHATRHVHATLLLEQGVPIKVVSERLGHSTIAMTMDVYAHVLPAMDRDAAAAIGATLDADDPASS